MKTSERHHLKTNEFAERVAHARDSWLAHRTSITATLVLSAVAVVAAGGFLTWRQQRAARATSALADAMVVAAAPVVPPATATPGSPQPPPPPTGSFSSPQARDAAAVEKLLGVANSYDSTASGLEARYQAASLLAQLGRHTDAAREFQAVVDRDPRGVYGRMARLGLADVSVQTGKYDAAIATLREFVSQPGELPVDGLLMQLGRAYALAGRKAEALQTFSRIVDEFPQSLYAADARREADALRGGTTERQS